MTLKMLATDSGLARGRADRIATTQQALERDMIVERTRAGLDAVKAQGRTGGRPTLMDADKLAAAQARKAKGESVTAIAKALSVSRATLYRALADTE